ncbi:MAG: hypothetical protein Q4P15_00225 [Propionibacteriaceae bacterium]|nr:hypothetical protein [Propionibacteriaceae bacterium]
MNGDDGVRQLSMRYGSLLDSLQRALETQIGPLLWRDRADAARTDDPRLVRVGPIFGSGVALETVDSAGLRSAVNEVLEHHGFHPIDSFIEEEWGEWHVTVADGHQAQLTISLSGAAEAHVAAVPA